MLVDGAVDAECDALEPPEGGQDDECGDSERDLLCALREAARGEDEVVEEVREHEHREVECRELRRKAVSMRIRGRE